MKDLLPLTLKKYRNNTYQVNDNIGRVVGFNLTKDEAEFLVTAANAYPIMRKALEEILPLLDKIYWANKSNPRPVEAGIASGKIKAALGDQDE